MNSYLILGDAEIVDFCDFLSPTQEEQASRAEAVRCVFDVIKYIWPNCKVILSAPLTFSRTHNLFIES